MSNVFVGIAALAGGLTLVQGGLRRKGQTRQKRPGVDGGGGGSSPLDKVPAAAAVAVGAGAIILGAGSLIAHLMKGQEKSKEGEKAREEDGELREERNGVAEEKESSASTQMQPLEWTDSEHEGKDVSAEGSEAEGTREPNKEAADISMRDVPKDTDISSTVPHVNTDNGDVSPDGEEGQEEEPKPVLADGGGERSEESRLREDATEKDEGLAHDRQQTVLVPAESVQQENGDEEASEKLPEATLKEASSDDVQTPDEERAAEEEGDGWVTVDPKGKKTAKVRPGAQELLGAVGPEIGAGFYAALTQEEAGAELLVGEEEVAEDVLQGGGEQAGEEDEKEVTQQESAGDAEAERDDDGQVDVQGSQEERFEEEGGDGVNEEKAAVTGGDGLVDEEAAEDEAGEVTGEKLGAEVGDGPHEEKAAAEEDDGVIEEKAADEGGDGPTEEKAAVGGDDEVKAEQAGEEEGDGLKEAEEGDGVIEEKTADEGGEGGLIEEKAAAGDDDKLKPEKAAEEEGDGLKEEKAAAEEGGGVIEEKAAEKGGSGLTKEMAAKEEGDGWVTVDPKGKKTAKVTAEELLGNDKPEVVAGFYAALTQAEVKEAGADSLIGEEDVAEDVLQGGDQIGDEVEEQVDQQETASDVEVGKDVATVEKDNGDDGEQGDVAGKDVGDVTGTEGDDRQVRDLDESPEAGSEVEEVGSAAGLEAGGGGEPKVTGESEEKAEGDVATEEQEGTASGVRTVETAVSQPEVSEAQEEKAGPSEEEVGDVGGEAVQEAEGERAGEEMAENLEEGVSAEKDAEADDVKSDVKGDVQGDVQGAQSDVGTVLKDEEASQAEGAVGTTEETGDDGAVEDKHVVDDAGVAPAEENAKGQEMEGGLSAKPETAPASEEAQEAAPGGEGQKGSDVDLPGEGEEDMSSVALGQNDATKPESDAEVAKESGGDASAVPEVPNRAEEKENTTEVAGKKEGDVAAVGNDVEELQNDVEVTGQPSGEETAKDVVEAAKAEDGSAGAEEQNTAEETKAGVESSETLQTPGGGQQEPESNQQRAAPGSESPGRASPKLAISPPPLSLPPLAPDSPPPVGLQQLLFTVPENAPGSDVSNIFDDISKNGTSAELPKSPRPIIINRHHLFGAPLPGAAPSPFNTAPSSPFHGSHASEESDYLEGLDEFNLEGRDEEGRLRKGSRSSSGSGEGESSVDGSQQQVAGKEDKIEKEGQEGQGEKDEAGPKKSTVENWAAEDSRGEEGERAELIKETDGLRSGGILAPTMEFPA